MILILASVLDSEDCCTNIASIPPNGGHLRALEFERMARRTPRLVRQCPACLVATAIVAMAVRAEAQDVSAFHEIETKYIFGFTVGSAIEIEGEKAFEPDTVGQFGKRSGSYTATGTELEYEFTPNQYMQIELGPTVAYYNIHNVIGLDDRNMGSLNGFVGNLRYLIIDRGPSPFAVTLAAEPEWHSLDETTGAKVVNYALETRVEADAELIKNRLFFGFNLLYEPETTRADLGAWVNESTFGESTALAFQIIPKVAVGVELWYLRHYEGLAFNTFTGDAVFLGPTFYWQVTPKILVSAAWNTQIAGHETGVAPALDLTDFSHQRARLLLEFEF
jgi:hypothetical protein